jgi:tyrosyl-tRNA synthetase
MDIESKIDIVSSLPTEEIITPERMRSLLESVSHPVHYFGLEVSGMLHIGHVLVGCKKINDLIKVGVKANILLADWHSVANNKLDGDWERIIKGAEFYRRVFGICCPDAKITLGSELYSNNDEYWKSVMRLATKTTIPRATRTLIIEGRSETDKLHVSQYLYPIMQAADILAFDADIPHAGMDQRRVHVLAMELFRSAGFDKEIVPLHHHLLASLLKPVEHADNREKEEVVAEMKMSKSKPGSAIPIIATDEEIERTIGGAWCPERSADGNPVLELCRYVIFPGEGSIRIERPERFGGDVDYHDYGSMERDYIKGRLHPNDLKGAVARSISRMVGSVRDRLDSNRDRELIGVFEGKTKV